MARKPNYRFERSQRERAKAEKKERKEEKRRQRDDGGEPGPSDEAGSNNGPAPEERG